MRIETSIEIKGLVSGDRRVYQHIFDTFYDSLCVFAHRFVADLAVCEDCVQETFISLWNSRENIKSIVHLKSFLYHVCRNHISNYLKHERIRDEYTTRMVNESDFQVCFINYVIEEEVERVLTRTEQELPPKCREIFVLAMQGKDNREIAQLLGVSENTVKTHKKNAYKLLKKNIIGVIVLVAFLNQ